MRRLVLLSILILTTSCGKDTPPAQTLDVASDVSQDVSNTEDLSTTKDVSTKETGTNDTGSDVTLDVSNDVADMAMFPDVAPQACTHPSTDPNCPMGEFGPALFLSQVEVVLDRTCCRDMNGDGQIDNRMGTILAAIAGLGVDINQDIANAIANGSLVYLVEFANWENEMFDPAFDATIYRGVDTDLDFADNLAGTGSFNLLVDSFDPATGDALYPFANSLVNAGELRAVDGTIDLRFPGLLPEVKIITSDLELTGTVDPSSNLESGGRVLLADGTLSGAMLRDRFFQSLNEASVGCQCIGREIFVPEGDGTFDCLLTAAEENACTADPEAGCRLMGQQGQCGLWGELGDDVDVDLDGDNVEDAFSIGLRVSGVGASIVGREMR